MAQIDLFGRKSGGKIITEQNNNQENKASSNTQSTKVKQEQGQEEKEIKPQVVEQVEKTKQATQIISQELRCNKQEKKEENIAIGKNNNDKIKTPKEELVNKAKNSKKKEPKTALTKMTTKTKKKYDCANCFQERDDIKELLVTFNGNKPEKKYICNECLKDFTYCENCKCYAHEDSIVWNRCPICDKKIRTGSKSKKKTTNNKQIDKI